MKTLKTLTLLLFITIVACSKNDDAATQPKPPLPQTNVYVAGSTKINNIKVPTIWKNGVASVLPSDTNENCVIQNIFVNGNNIYAVGLQFDGNNNGIVVWKNNVIVTSILNADYEKAILQNDDVYIIGSQENSNFDEIHKCWKNGVETVLSNNQDCSLNDIIVYNNDVYVCGTEEINNFDRLILWKNGISTAILPENTNSFAHAVFVQNDEVNVIFGQENTGTIPNNYDLKKWKNNQITSIQNNGPFGFDVKKVIFDGIFNYVIANSFTSPNYKIRYFRNGFETPNIQTSSQNFSTDMIVNNNDVYIAGHDGFTAPLASNGIFKIWKNGQPMNFSEIVVGEIVTKLFYFENKLFALGDKTNSFWIENIRQPVLPGNTPFLRDIIVVNQ